MKAYPQNANPENGMRHDAGITLDSNNEFIFVIPHLLCHLQKKQLEADPVSAEAIEKRINGIETVRKLVISGDIADKTLEIRLTPIESEAVRGRLLGSHCEVSEDEIALGGIVGNQLAQQYHDQYKIIPPTNKPEQGHIVPSMRLSVESIGAPAL